MLNDFKLSGTVAIVGLGKTGLATVRFLQRFDVKVKVFESNDNSKYISYLRQFFPHIELFIGYFPLQDLQSASIVVMSPGVCPLVEPWNQLDS